MNISATARHIKIALLYCGTTGEYFRLIFRPSQYITSQIHQSKIPSRKSAFEGSLVFNKHYLKVYPWRAIQVSALGVNMSVSHYLCHGDLPIFCLFEAPFCLGWHGWKLLLSGQISSSMGAVAPVYLVKIKNPKGEVCSDPFPL